MGEIRVRISFCKTGGNVRFFTLGRVQPNSGPWLFMAGTRLSEVEQLRNLGPGMLHKVQIADMIYIAL